MKTSKVLIVDDEPETRVQITRWLHSEGYTTEEAASGEEALEKVKQTDFSVVLLDLKLPTMDGFEVLNQLHRDYPDTCVIILTAYPDTERTKRALREGAFDFFDKPIKFSSLLPRIEIAAERFNFAREGLYQREEEQRKYSFENIIGKNPKMREVFELVKKVAASDTTVLVRGESGTGKELIASAIHHNSLRADKPWIIADCGAMAEGVIESDLFGHERGAFTGALRRKIGKLERANGGSLFIDEIGDMTPKLQMKLLRFLQERTFERVGGEGLIETNVRIIVATHKDLEKVMEERQFREDLFYRISVFPIFLPPLRERIEDIPLLVDHFIKKFSMNLRKRVSQISSEALDILMKYKFPGNIRELENIIERAVILEDGTTLSAKSLPTDLGEFAAKKNIKLSELNFKQAKEEFEKWYVKEVLEKADCNISKAAKLASMDRGNFKEKMKKYLIKKSD